MRAQNLPEESSAPTSELYLRPSRLAADAETTDNPRLPVNPSLVSGERACRYCVSSP